jgi:sarcosine oxidase subunit alpha
VSELPYRLPAGSPHGFGGTAIDRKRPIRFRIDGRPIDGFAGDTVLSALLAAGIVAVGARSGEPVGLDARTAPPVVIAGPRERRGGALPMARTPALDGAELATVGRFAGGLRSVLDGLRRRPAGSLGLRLGDGAAFTGPWHRARPDRTIATDLLVVGGGIAGMSAAASTRGRVLLVERGPQLGGVARFFGSVEGEEAPEEAIARLGDQLAARGNAETMTSAEVLALSGTDALVHRVWVEGGVPHGEVIRIEARRVVLATGCLERLPVFAGNRLPAVRGVLEAHHLATRYGVWLGRRAAFATPHNFTYRFALHAREAGIEVQRVADPRLSPRSRYIDFCKASGLPLAAAVAVSRASSRRGTTPLDVGFSVAIEDIAQDGTPLTTDLLVAAGGLQPDLSLWLAAGGSAGWDGRRSLFEPAGSVRGVVLAGAATGLRGTAAAIASGEAAISTLSGRRPPNIADRVIDAAYESDDAPTPISRAVAIPGAPAFLDGGTTFTTLAAALSQRHGGKPQLLARAIRFSIGDIAAAVELGAVPQDAAGELVSERCVIGGEIIHRAWRVDNPPLDPGVAPVPSYLHGRFGADPRRCILMVADSRRFEPGCLIFPSSDLTDPARAIGVVYAAAPGGRSGGLALMGVVPGAIGATVFVRDAGRSVAAQVMERLRGA